MHYNNTRRQSLVTVSGDFKTDSELQWCLEDQKQTILQGGKATRRVVDHPALTSAEVKAL